MLACNAILAALNARHHTGRGQKVELSLYETSLAMLVSVGVSWLNTHSGDARIGNGHGSLVPYATYKAADGWMVIAVGNDGQFAKCAGVLSHPEWTDDPRFATNRARVGHRQLLDGLINEALAHDKAQAWLDKLMAVGVPCGRINTVAQALENPHTAARRMVETAQHPVIGELKMLGIPFKFSDTPASVRRAPPTLGQHTDEILAQDLKLDAGTIAKLRSDKVI
jgi:crotonobetainyl-CoA:carnitine CoA-transferase CaiB-like acyl-CoA transferase